MRCGDCRHFHRGDYPTKEFGGCHRWEMGYDARSLGPMRNEVLSKNEVLVESDEGWGAIVGEDFGCVLFEEEGAR